MKQNPATSTAVRAVRKSLHNILRHIFGWAEEARYRAMQREIQHIIGQADVLSDEIERRITLHLMRSGESATALTSGRGSFRGGC